MGKVQTKDELSNKEVSGHIIQIINEKFNEWVLENDPTMKKLCTRIIQFAKAADAIKKNMDKIVKLSSVGSLTISPKFTDCEIEDPEIAELLIVEGDSAAGSVKRARENYQAVYALKGKIKNVYGSRAETIMDSQQISEIVKILFGTNDIKNIDYSKIKFKKIIILADADVDGSHIVSLVVSLFEEHFPELLEKGYVYIGLSPLYRITVKNKYKYFRNDEAFNSFKTDYLKDMYDIHSKTINLKYIVAHTEDFFRELTKLKVNHSVTDDIISLYMRETDKKVITKELKSMGLEVSKNQIIGLADDTWVQCDIDDDFLNSINELKKIMKDNVVVTIKDKKEDEYYECDIIDLVKLLEDSFKFSRYRFKGLTE